MRIYLVEDDENIRELVAYTLKAGGYEAEGFPDGEEFFAALERQAPDLVLLDIMLPGEDGIQILKRLRAGRDTGEIPVILLTAKSAEYDKVLGLDSGADDYVTKPFGMMELLSRVRAVLRRTDRGRREAPVLSAGSIALDPGRRSVEAGGREVVLTVKEFDLLHALMESPGLVFTREQLLSRVWDYDFDGETRTVDVHIGSLRRKLGDAGDAIETLRGVGYRVGKGGKSQ